MSPYPFPPTDGEWAEMDLRSHEFRMKIGSLEALLTASREETRIAREAKRTALEQKAEVEAALTAALEEAAKYRRVVEFYAGQVSDNGQKAREVL